MKKTHTTNSSKERLKFFCRHWVSKAMLLLLVSTLFLSNKSSATHFRGGHLTWKYVSSTEVEFTLVDAFNRSLYSGSAGDGKPAIDDIVTENIGGTMLFFGDGNSTPQLFYKVTAIDPTNNWFLAVALEPGSSTKKTINHTYSASNNSGAPWIAEINDGDRTSGEINNPDGAYQISTYVDLSSVNNSPSSSLPAIVNLPVSATASFFVPAADSDPNTYLRYRLAGPNEAGNGFVQPLGISINPISGIATCNTTFPAVLGGLYSCQIVIEDYNSITDVWKTSVAIDFLIYITNCEPTNSTPVFSSPSPLCGTVINAFENVPLAFTVNATDADVTDIVELNSGGVPSGATLTPSLPTAGNPVSSTFNWTPGLGTAGDYVVTFSATDNCGAQSLCSYTIHVAACTPPSCSITAVPSNSIYTGGVPTNIYLGYGPQSATLNVAVTNGIAAQWAWTGSFLSCNNCAHPVFTPTSPGTYTLTVTVTTTLGCTTTCTITFCVISVRDPGKPGKVILCHVPPGNPGNPQTLSVSINAVPTHLSMHSGDRLGYCGQSCNPVKVSTQGNMLILNENNELQVLVYPNPFTNGFHIKVERADDQQVNVRLFNITGQTLQTITDLHSDQDLSLGNDLTSGIYFLEVQQGDFKKVVIVNKMD